MTPLPQESRRRAPTRRPTPNMVAALLTLVILVGSGVVADRILTGPAPPPNRFVPADGSATGAWWQQNDHRARASVENARLHGVNVFGAFPTSLTNHAAPVPGLPIRDTEWWREATVPSRFADPAPRLRLRSISADGIRLHAQDWGRHSAIFDPAPVELPASVAVGDSWSDHGAASTGSNSAQTYRRTSRALRPESAADATAGCILVRSQTTVTTVEQPEGAEPPKGARQTIDWRENQTWCPGAGVVSSSGSVADTAASDSTTFRLTPDNGEADPIDPDLLRSSKGAPAAVDEHWTSTGLQFNRGDDTFGPAATDLDIDLPLSERSSIDRLGSLHVVASNTTDVVTGYPLQPGNLWLHGWAHPGGSITSVTSVGMLTVVSTDRRVLRSYDPYGRVRWTRTLPDITPVAPVRAPKNRLLVTTIRGDLIMIDARTGAPIWTHRLPGPITIPPVVGEWGVAVGSATTLTVLDFADGQQRWSQDTTDPIAVAAAGDTVAVLSYGELNGYSRSDGRFRWRQFRDADLREMITVDDQLVLTSTSSIEAISAAGRHLWQQHGAPITTTRIGRTVITTSRQRVSALSSDGAVLAQWAAPAAVTADRRLLATAGVLLSIGRTDDYSLAGRMIAAPERAPS